MALLVRSWNVFHGNSDPPSRRGYLREMVELATSDGPDALCLQELPLWSLRLLESWSGMWAAASMTLPPLLPRRLAGWITRGHQGLLRSAIAGQANAILVSPGHVLEDLGATWLSLPWQHPRRCHALRLDDQLVVVNLHTSADPGEVERAFGFADAVSRPAEPVVVAGDFNLQHVERNGYSAPWTGIDHVLVRGLGTTPLLEWPRERRLQNGVVLSDHAPVEVRVG